MAARVMGSNVALWMFGALSLLVGTAQAQRTLAYGSITGNVLNKETGEVLNFANVVILGSTMGGMVRGGAFAINRVPVGSYSVRASFMGFQPSTRVDVRVDAGKSTSIEFRLQSGVVSSTGTIFVNGAKPAIDVGSSEVSHGMTGEKMSHLPVETLQEAVALNTGVVVSNSELHVRGGRANEVSVRIDGISVDDPLSGGSVDLGLLSVAQSELITGGMDAEYGNASSAIINYTTKSGGRNFEGNFRYTTDNYGRGDKTFTNYDRFSLGMGGPTPFQDLKYYVSGEATFSNGEVLTVKNYSEHKYLGGLLKTQDRSDSEYRAQARLDWKASEGVKMSGEMTLSKSVSDPYLHNWNTEGYVSKIVIYPEIRINRFNPKYHALFGSVTLYDGPWRQKAQGATYVDIRDDPWIPGISFGCQYCKLHLSDNTTIRAVRVEDFQGRGTDITKPPVYAFTDYVIFEGYQNPLSNWTPELTGALGDTNKTYYNAAAHTYTTANTSKQVKWTLTHTLSTKSFYEVKLSRLSFDVLTRVNDQTPDRYSTGGKFVWIPGRGPTPIGTVEYYTDPSVPFFATAYDYPRYSRRDTQTYLVKSDITTQHWKNHGVKGGLEMRYNDLDFAQLASPGRQRNWGDPYGYSRNVFHNFNPEGSAYFQDRWEYEGMVVNGGVRYDFFSPGSGVGIELRNDTVTRQVQRWKTQFSPRLGLAFPITDRDVFHFHYGRFIQFPEKSQVFASQDVNAPFGTWGNPNLDPETSIAYQAGIKHQFSATVSGQFALFNKDYYGLISSIAGVTDAETGNQNTRYVNKAYASSRGIELQLNKDLSRNFAFDLAYTYSYADGVASDADFGVQGQGLTYLPTGELPLDWDQRHTFNATFTVLRAGDWSATTVYQFGSGQPWTPFFRFQKKQDPLLENSRRFPSTHTVNFRGEKYFKIYGQDLRLFFDGRNLLDEKQIVDINPSIAPGLRNATEGYIAYATEQGKFGGAYLQDSDGDGRDEFFAVHDPRVYGQRRLFRIGLGFEF